MPNGVSRDTWNDAKDPDTKLNLLFDMHIDTQKALAPKRIFMIAFTGGCAAVAVMSSPKLLTLASVAIAGS